MEGGTSGLLSKRHDWMVERLRLSFGIDQTTCDKFIREQRRRIDSFLNDPLSQPKLFFFYQPHTPGAAPELSMNQGEADKLESKCVYFVRDSVKPINLKVSQDNTVLCGEIGVDLLASLEQSLAEVYVPLLQQQASWGKIKTQREKAPFLESINQFQNELHREIQNLHGDVQLAVPQAPYDNIEQKPAAFARAARDYGTVNHCLQVLASWISSIEQYLAEDKSNVPLAASVESGPEVEIEYWSRRMLTLISVTEQLKARSARSVIGVLKARALRTDADENVTSTMTPAQAARRAEDDAAEQEHAKSQLEKWRETDLAITDALNEAKDNVRFLENLRLVLEPLSNQPPSEVADSMPSIMSSMKMIHTLSRYYGTDVRMTNLFMRITNALCHNSRRHIYDITPDSTATQAELVAGLWARDPVESIQRMQSCLALYDAYRFHYSAMKEKLALLPKGKQFHFDENQIFHKFTRFRRRLEKLVDMFTSCQQFQAIRKKRIDGLDALLSSFSLLVNDFKNKGHDLLDFQNVNFERDFVEFTMQNSGLEKQITEFLSVCLGSIHNIEKQIELLINFTDIAIKPSLREDLDTKWLMVFRLYGEELIQIQAMYEKHKANPPIARHCTRVAGNIQWSRQLLRKITSPMKTFQLVPKVFAPKDSKKVVKNYNRLAKILIEFETVWFQAWAKSTDLAKKGLRSRLLVPASSNGIASDAPQYAVNFDLAVLTLMKEAKHLQLMGFEIPSSAKVVLLLEPKLKGHHADLVHAINQYHRVTARILPSVKALLQPHIQDLTNVIAPGLTLMTWTSMNIDTYIQSVRDAVAVFEHLTHQISDICDNRIAKNLQLISNLTLFAMPSAPVSLKDFSNDNDAQIHASVATMLAKNEEIERAVDDLIEAILNYKLNVTTPSMSTAASPRDQAEQPVAFVDQPKVQARTQIDARATATVKLHFEAELYSALVTVIQRNLRSLAYRLSNNSAAVFGVEVSLTVPAVTLAPSLNEMNEALSNLSTELISSMQSVTDWGIDLNAFTLRKTRHPLHDRLNQDQRVVNELKSLKSAQSTMAKHCDQFLEAFSSYSWLWTADPEVAYKQFVATASTQPPLIDDFIQELNKFTTIEGAVGEISSVDSIGAIEFRTDPLKAALKHEVERWKGQYSEKLHHSVKSEMDALSEQMHEMKARLEREVKDFASLKFVMDVQAEIRDLQSNIDQRFDEIIEKYNILEKYLPGGQMSKDEMDTKSVLKTHWQSINTLASGVMANIQGLQSGFKQDLLDNVKVFKQSVKSFRQDYDLNGPMTKGVSPLEAITRLNKYKREFETLNRKYELYSGGEKLFGLPQQQYPELENTKKELKLLDQLYSLYQQVISTVDEYKGIPWSEVVANIGQMNETVEALNERCRRLPKGLKSWEAFVELNKTIEDFLEVLPLLTELSKPSMRDRHWKKISQLTGKDFDVEKFHEMRLRTVLEANLLTYHEDIVEITDSAEKQLAIEKKLTEIAALWDVQSFEFAAWKERGDVILAGSTIAVTIEQLEDSQASLIQMLTQRHVTPFRDQANGWLKKLSDVNDTLESWIKVQMLWMSLESVFTGGDIARQMPSDTRVFLKVDKEWTTRLMNKAKDVKNVVDSCQNEYIRNMLPTMFADLEKCQKALDGYLEQKRLRFPRFYFVSNPALLLILSQGSDKEAVQQCFNKVFDAIDRVEFQGNNITKIRSLSPGYEGQDSEDVTLTKPVATKGNIEDWLTAMLREMRRTMKDVIRAGSQEYESMQWPDFVAKYCAQVTLLGIQFCWTSDVQEALMRIKHDKGAIGSAFKKQTALLNELSAMTTTDIKTKVERTKVETLVTIQVHQRDVLQDLVQRYKDKKLKDVYDFEWQKQLRCYWQPEEDECVVKIADVDFVYCHEYLGCKERLVVTPLTDRCYVSLSQALGMAFGGAPAGPAGTGKTETTKDLGRALGKLVVVFNCFPEVDTRVLTNRGMLFLHEIEALITQGDEVLYACYEISSDSIVYRAGKLVERQAPDNILTFTNGGEQTDSTRINSLSLRVTAGHQMYVQTGDLDVCGATVPYRKVAALDLSLQQGQDMRMLGCASNGIQRDSAELSFYAALKLDTPQKVCVFLELFGFWLGDGTMTYTKGVGAYAVVFAPRKLDDKTFLDDSLAALDINFRRHDVARGMSHYHILEPSWLTFWHELYGDKYEDESDDVKCLPPWALNDLTKDESRLILEGLRRADGACANDEQVIYTSGFRFRDQIVHLALQAGFSAHFELMYKKGSVQGLDAWKVSYAEPNTVNGEHAAWPNMSCSEITSVPASTEDGRLWCVEVDHKDHLIFAQRAVCNDEGVVVKASRPVITGNCSDQMHTADTAKIFKGLCQSGSWGCFDEFNRIDLEVLSVVAQQVQAVLTAVRARADTFVFPGDDTGEILLDDRCGFFITMNPGYAGRQELPENLKALFRSCAMMVPDREIIIKVKLASVGYMDFQLLAKKFRVLYGLCEEQLSKQRHYDFGLRNILSVLRTAGINLRLELGKDANQDRAWLEEMLMMRTLRDMNLSKLVADDVDLFIQLLHDLFPNQKDPEKRRYDREEAAMLEVINEQKLVPHESWLNKIVQLYETSLVRHGLMLVGPSGSGKTAATRVLIDALTNSYEKHLLVRMNPKAIRAEEMFGENDAVSSEWTNGIFSALWQKYNDTKKPRTWLVCDGPVDAIWIENLNSVLDDNKLLTLANGDRLPMTDNVRLLFEVQDLRNASPATVSRAGIIFVSGTDLGYEPIVTAWLRTRRDDEAAIIEALYDKYVRTPELLIWLARSCRNVMQVSDVHLITNCFNLFQGLLAECGTEKTHASAELERLFMYCLCWSLGGLLESEDRLKFSRMIMELSHGNMPQPFDPAVDSLYDFYVNTESLAWERWEAPEWEYNAATFNFSTCLVPTVDSARAEYLIDTMLTKVHKPVLILGSTGTAKTSIILQYTNSFDNSKMLLKKVNFSSATTAGMFQVSMEADIEKRQGKTFAPPGGRFMTVFLDDISMPEVNKWGDQPTLELVRQLIETGGFYFLQKDKRGDKMAIENVAYVAAMNHPGGGRNDIPDRLKRHFFCFNMTPPSQLSIDNIYGSMLRGRFEAHPQSTALVPLLTAATIDLWQAVKSKMLPTPSKFHYIFNMRDLARVFQGVLHSPFDVVTKGNNLLAIWKHECQRVFSDKLTNPKDKKWFDDAIARVITDKFEPVTSDATTVRDTQTYFVDFLRDEIIDEETEEVLEDAPKIYEPSADVDSLRKRVEDFLTKHNSQPGVKAMPLVLFNDALEHMMRIARIIGMPRGNALLVGVGGSGRQSLTRLAAYVAKQDVFQIQITRTYKMADFLDDIRKLYVAVGKEGKKTTWILTDFDIVNEEFLEYINAILTTGEVAGLFPKDERDMMCSDLRTVAKKENKDFIDTPDNLYSYFLSRLRDNLHIVLCFSPANEKFAERARRFPGLISGCTIDWFLRWPEAALVDVSHKFLTEDKAFKVEADAKVEKQLVRHIASVHNLVTEACDEYFAKFRRAVYVTPKSYLSYIKSYKEVYKQKLGEIATQQRNVETGLKKLKEAEVDVNRLQGVLEQQNIELGIADKAATAMLQKLEVSSKEALGKKQAAEVIEAKCSKTAAMINEERAVANKELEAAMPFVTAAEKAAKSVNKKDIGIIQKLGKPPDLIKRILDCVLILFSRPLDKVSMTEIKTGKTDFQMFITDSYDSQAKKFMVESGFVPQLLDFANEEKDQINEETMEFLEPYLNCIDFTAERAKTVSSAAEGLLKWVRAMASYHTASLIVGPKLEQLQIKTNQFNAATAKLKAAQAQSKAAQDEVDKLQEQFETTMREKAALEQQAKETGEKMIAANNLIKSLAGEKKRWQSDALAFAEDKKRLVGSCALACAFVSYLGPFNHEFRKRLLNDYFYKDCINSGIPVTKDLDLNKFLVDDGTIAEWNSQGLPKDDLSIQNGILVTQASRWPLLIDPQGQALSWLKKREAANFPIWGTTTLSNPKLRDQLEFCMENGSPLLVEGVVKELDPMLDPVLEKNVVARGRSFYIVLGDKQVSMDPNFRVYFITKLSNPLFSPELSAKTTIIDFSVTQKGLEDQLLSRVIQTEQKSLEDQRQKLIEEVNANTISLQSLDKQLLERLSASSGNLLDDVALIGVLADTKTKAQEVKEKIEASVTTEAMINKRREHYRPVATRGSVLYFVIVSMAAVNCMYQSSLAQFLQWFDLSLAEAEKANLVQKRVEILMKHLTYEVYININRGLFEVDKLTFKLMVTMKILVTESEGSAIDEKATRVLLQGGAGLNLNEMPKKPFDWLQQTSWMNILSLNYNIDFFSDLKSSVESNEAEWRKWYEAEAPESTEIPRLEDRLQSHPAGSFMRFLVVRSFRDDRTRLAANAFIGSVLGERFIEPAPASFEEIHRVSDNKTPVILLLTPGADPTSQLEELAKKKGVKIYPVSMGEGQEPHATRSVTTAMQEGAWSLLQNCHLGLGFMNKLEELIHKSHEETTVDPAFRVWITCEPHPEFPINLLQMSVKVTNEPPRGMKAGLLRSYTNVIDAERLARVETKEWRDLVFTLSFLHSTVQERRKFGPIGFCIPYEFNTSDLEASLTFLEKHCFSTTGLSWPTVRYMISQVQYGGRITDDLDAVLFQTFAKLWLGPDCFKEDFSFAQHAHFKYAVPQCDSMEGYQSYISAFPAHDSPEIFGLHVNADLTFGTNEAMYILNTISETQPKESGSKAGGKTREEVVYEKADELLALCPKTLKDDAVRDLIRKRSRQENEFVLGTKPDANVDGFSIPLNIFLYQEICRLNRTIQNVRSTLTDLKSAINGEIIMTPELQAALNFVFDGKPPLHWYKDASGAEIAWFLPSLALWFAGLLDREKQLSQWLNTTRPITYWMTGFFNPQGFLTATRQEITRRHKAEKWALDDVVLVSSVTDHTDIKKIKLPPSEGVYVHGLFLEGASWDRREGGRIVESHAKELFTPLPVLHVSAVTSKQAEKMYSSGKDDIKFYDCPVYKQPKRTGLAYIFSVKLRTQVDPDHWVLRGVALLCSKD